MMKYQRRVIVVLISIFLFTMIGCGPRRPLIEIVTAQEAIQAAREAGAEQYALQQLRIAQDRLAQAQAARRKKARSIAEQAKRDAEIAQSMAKEKARQLAEEEIRKRAEEEARRRAAEEARRRVEEEARRRAAEEARRRAAEEARRRVEKEVARKKALQEAERAITEAQTAIDKALSENRVTGEAEARIKEAREALVFEDVIHAKALAEESMGLARTAKVRLSTTYRVAPGDNLRKIAGYQKIYGDPEKWKVIFEANKDKLKNPDLLRSGQLLRIPRE